MLALVGAATFLDAFAGMLPGRSIVEHCRVNHDAEKYATYLSQPQCRAWVAETVAQAGPVGYAMVTKPDLPLPDLREDDLEVKRIYLLSRFHGGGTGRRLMQAAVTGAQAMGGRRLFLGVFAGNARAIAFYKKEGFRVVGERTFQMGFSVFDDLVLGRDL